MIESLPLALAIAASPFAIIPAIMLLLTPRPGTTAGAFLGAWFLGVAIVAGMGVALADVIDAYGTSPRWVAWARLALSLVIGTVALRTWLSRRVAPTPAWLNAVQTADPRRAAVLGFALSCANPKVIMLAIAGGLSIGAAESSVAAEIGWVAIFAAVASATVAAPLLAFAVAGKSALPTLGRLRAWLESRANAIMAIILAAIAVVLAVSGFNGL